MPRPQSWFIPSEHRDAKRAAKERQHTCWKYVRKTRKGKEVTGYFVGKKLPVRLQTPSVDASPTGSN